METRESILKYAGYSAYIATQALNLDDVGVLSAQRCRWLICEFNINEKDIPKKWLRLFGSLNNRLKVKVSDFDNIKWDEKTVRAYCDRLTDDRRLMYELRKTLHDYEMDVETVAARFGKTASQFDDMMKRSVWLPEDLLKAVRNSLPFDEGFPGRFQLSIGGANI